MADHSYSAWLQGTSGVMTGRQFGLGEGPLCIGRGTDCQLRLEDAYVSRHHAQIHFQAGAYVIFDLNSSHGTWVNGVKIKHQALNNGDTIRVGNQDFIFYRAAMPVVQARTATAGPSVPGQPVAGASAPASPPRSPLRRWWIVAGLGGAGLLALCACVFVISLLGQQSGNSGTSAGTPAYISLEEAIAQKTTDDRPEILARLGRPDAFSASRLEVEGGEVVMETWRYYQYGMRVDFVDGEIAWTMDIEAVPLGTIFPGWYDPLEFQAGMSAPQAVRAAAAASPAGTQPQRIDLSAGGEDLAGGELLVGDQIIIGVSAGRVVSIETIALFPEESE